MKTIKFTKHAILRARERNLLEYLNKKRFYYDAEYVDPGIARIGRCTYSFVEKEKVIIIKTMF